MLLVLAAPATSSRTAASFDPGRASIDIAQSAVVQRDGKIVVAGISRRFSQFDFALARYTASGKLDSSFATGGLLLTHVGRGASPVGVVALAEQANGKLILAGGASTSDHQGAFAVSRYARRGVVDARFGRGGTVLTSFRKPGGVSGVALQRDGRIVVAGWTGDTSTVRVALARCTRSGTLDATFGKGGKVEIDSAALRDLLVYAVALQRDGTRGLADDFWRRTCGVLGGGAT